MGMPNVEEAPKHPKGWVAWGGIIPTCEPPNPSKLR
jgi:hypothetical protein